MNFTFMLSKEDILLQTSISVEEEWDLIARSNPTRIVDELRRIIVKWVRDEQQAMEGDVTTHDISVTALSNTAIFTGDSALFDPSELDLEEYDALSVQIWGAIKGESQYRATLKDIKGEYEDALDTFGAYLKENLKFIPTTDDVRANCTGLADLTYVMSEEVNKAYIYFMQDKRDVKLVSEIIADLMAGNKKIETLIKKIQNTILPKNWETDTKYAYGIPIDPEDKTAFEKEVTLTYLSNADATNSTAWSLVQYVASAIEEYTR